MEDAITCNHNTYYFADGNIVLGCKNSTGGMTYFRVHKSYLASQSTVVSDMLTLPNSEGNHEMHDGVPLVNFPDTVKAEAMDIFLTFFYEPINDHLSPDDNDIAYKLFDVLVLTDMLMVDKLQTSIINRIKQDWAIPSIYDWLRRFNSLNPKGGDWFYRFYEPASVIRVARRIDETLFTPLQLFELSVRDPFLPYRLTVPFSRQLALDACPNPGARWDLVSHRDRLRAGTGHRRFLREFHARVLRLLSPPELTSCKYGPCQHVNPSTRTCQSALEERVQFMTLNVLRGCHPFKALEAAKHGSSLAHEFKSGWVYDAVHEECAEKWDFAVDDLLEILFYQIPEFYA